MRGRLTGGLMLIAILTVGLVAVGCGGGDDNLTKAEFVNQANAICKKANDQINKAAQPLFDTKEGPSQAEQNKFATETLVPLVQTEIDEIRDLNPPSEDEDQVNALLDEAQSALDKGKKDPAVLTSDEAFKKADKLADDYGIKECGTG